MRGRLFPGVPKELVPKNLPIPGRVYTIREIVTGSDAVNGQHWTEAPGIVGLIFEELRNDRRLTTNGPDQEQAFDEGELMPLCERKETAELHTEA